MTRQKSMNKMCKMKIIPNRLTNLKNPVLSKKKMNKTSRRQINKTKSQDQKIIIINIIIIMKTMIEITTIVQDTATNKIEEGLTNNIRTRTKSLYREMINHLNLKTATTNKSQIQTTIKVIIEIMTTKAIEVANNSTDRDLTIIITENKTITMKEIKIKIIEITIIKTMIITMIIILITTIRMTLIKTMIMTIKMNANSKKETFRRTSKNHRTNLRPHMQQNSSQTTATDDENRGCIPFKKK